MSEMNKMVVMAFENFLRVSGAKVWSGVGNPADPTYWESVRGDLYVESGYGKPVEVRASEMCFDYCDSPEDGVFMKPDGTLEVPDPVVMTYPPEPCKVTCGVSNNWSSIIEIKATEIHEGGMGPVVLEKRIIDREATDEDVKFLLDLMGSAMTEDQFHKLMVERMHERMHDDLGYGYGR